MKTSLLAIAFVLASGVLSSAIFTVPPQVSEQLVQSSEHLSLPHGQITISIKRAVI